MIVAVTVDPVRPERRHRAAVDIRFHFPRLNDPERRRKDHLRARVRGRAGWLEHLRDQLSGSVRRNRVVGCCQDDRRTGGREERHAVAGSCQQSCRHQEENALRPAVRTGRGCRRRRAWYHQDANHCNLMELRGQQKSGERGYAMAALLVALAVMGVLASAAMPSWKQMAQREKEAELIFRGQQYARAIGLFQRRAGPGVNPPSLDVLVQQKFLRKKYKDPITGGDFDLISPTTPMAVPTSPTPGGQTGTARATLPGTAATGRSTSPGPATHAAVSRSRCRVSGAARSPAGHRSGSAAPWRAASSACKARARLSRFASTTAARITTSGSSSTFPRPRQPGGRGQPGVPQPAFRSAAILSADRSAAMDDLAARRYSTRAGDRALQPRPCLRARAAADLSGR